MFKFNYFLLTIFCACLFNKFCLPQGNCGIYKNTKFEFWGTDCGNFCHQVNKNVTCMWFQKHQGCFCKDGFYRDRTWDCVPLQGCDSGLHKEEITKPVVIVSKECPANEVWKKCENDCMNLCESLNNPKKCANEKCSEGCFCKEGMLRNYNGNCIRKSSCSQMMSSATTKYQYNFGMSVSLSLHVKQSYALYGWKSTTIETLEEMDSCDPLNCQFNTHKAEPKCKANEEYTTCGEKCTEKCVNVLLPENCPITCEIGCFCKGDYYRNEQGLCIPAQKCPEYNKNRKVITTTTTRRPPPRVPAVEQIIPIIRPTKVYITSTTTTTLHPMRRIAQTECPVNERFDQCGSHCNDLCENANKTMQLKTKVGKCSPNMNCMTGCFCKQGFLRDMTDTCVPIDKCPQPQTTPKPPVQCNLNEIYTECGSKCSESCDLFKGNSSVNCPPTCDEGCFCMQGFYRDKFGQCVPQDQCQCELEPLKCKDPKEEYLVCGKNCLETCDIKTPDCQQACSRGCFCKPGFVYNENGVCVAPDQCGKDIRNGTKAGNIQIIRPGNRCPNPNEKWSNCGDQCNDFCKPNFDVKKCSLKCVPGCICKKGFKRNTVDQCVPLNKCDEKPVCGENEEYMKCGNSCFFRCKDIGRSLKCPLKCTEGCFCKPGFLKDEFGKCMIKSKCPRDLTPDCPINEVYKNCSTHCGETCEDLKSPIECPKECEKGCFCADGYYRDVEGVCGTKLDCNLPPPAEKDKFCSENEVHKECGNRCEDTCSYNSKCKKTCESGCFCLQEFLRNAKGKCVHSDHCMGPPQCAVCKPNEYYTSCGTDCGRMCSDIGKNTSCSKSSSCHKGCVCKWGFFRTLDGECVTKNECQVINEEEERQVEYVTTEDPEDISHSLNSSNKNPIVISMNSTTSSSLKSSANNSVTKSVMNSSEVINEKIVVKNKIDNKKPVKEISVLKGTKDVVQMIKSTDLGERPVVAVKPKKRRTRSIRTTLNEMKMYGKRYDMDVLGGNGWKKPTLVYDYYKQNYEPQIKRPDTEQNSFTSDYYNFDYENN